MRLFDDFGKDHRRVERLNLSFEAEQATEEEPNYQVLLGFQVNPFPLPPKEINDKGFERICEKIKKLVFLKHLTIHLNK